MADAFIGIWSPWIIGELYRVLTWQWLERTRDFSPANATVCGRNAKSMMTLLIATFETVSPVPPYPPAWPGFADVDDHPSGRLSGSGDASPCTVRWIPPFPPVGPDGRHTFQGIKYITVEDFLDGPVRLVFARSWPYWSTSAVTL